MKKAKIYSLKEKGKTIYIGKSTKLKDNGINMSAINVIYQNEKLKNVKNKTVEILEEVEVNDWFDPKLNQIVKHHKDGAKLINAQFLLDGKRGYWEGTKGYWHGKKRDENTIKRMTESKFKRVCQYDLNGNLIKVWNSINQVANHLGFQKKYGGTTLNDKLNTPYLITKKIKGFYWIKREDIKYYSTPKKINIPNIIKQQKEEKKRKTLETRIKNGTININNCEKEIVRIYNDGQKGKTFNSILDAANYYKITPSAISKVCRYIAQSCYDGKYVFEFVDEKHRNKYAENKKKLEDKLYNKFYKKFLKQQKRK